MLAFLVFAAPALALQFRSPPLRLTQVARAPVRRKGGSGPKV